jgi:Ca2+:H+ antiporter
VARRILWGSLALAPATIFVHYAFHPGEVVEFVLAALALIPLAWLIGEATEQAAHHTGPGIGGFLNATFGNAPELIISLIAIHEGLTEVVRGSLTGSVVGNLLLVLGFSLLFGPKEQIDRQSSFIWIGLIGLSTALLLIPAVPSWHGNPERHALAILSLPVSIALLLVYVVTTWYTLRRHRQIQLMADPADAGAWRLRSAVLVLGLATVVTAVIAEILVTSLEVFGEKAHLSDFFVAAVIVAIVGNAAEHGGAVVVAYRGRIRLAVEIALSSSAQVAVFLIPAVALLSWLIEPLALSFRLVELAALAGSTAFVAALLGSGRCSRARGVALIGAYAVVAVAFFVADGR